MKQDDLARLENAAAEAVREESRQGRLAALEDVLAALEADGAFLAPVGLDADGPRPWAGDMTAALAAALAAAPGIASFKSISGQTAYHAPKLLSHSYARILDSKGSPLRLMAEEIRSNSRDYPRPVPVELFEAQPFGLTPEDIGQHLQAMAENPDYQDIAVATTATGAMFLFSTRHLERGYAEYLAQRAESLIQNP